MEMIVMPHLGKHWTEPACWNVQVVRKSLCQKGGLKPKTSSNVHTIGIPKQRKCSGTVQQQPPQLKHLLPSSIDSLSMLAPASVFRECTSDWEEAAYPKQLLLPICSMCVLPWFMQTWAAHAMNVCGRLSSDLHSPGSFLL